MRRVRVFFLGGTAAMTGASNGASQGLEPGLGGHDLLASLAAPPDVVVEVVDVARVDSSALTLDTCLDTVARADAAVRLGETDAVVVVQGTDTLEETAYLWDLLWPHPHPFVVTGAMRPPGAPGADGPANLEAAVLVAASPSAVDQGVVVTLGDEIHAARYVTKRHTSSPSAFTSPDLGPVGRMHEGVPVLHVRLPRRATLPFPASAPPVGLVRASLDDDPAFYRAVGQVCEGLVVEGFGAGQVRPQVAEVLVDLAARTPVVLTSRTGAGPVAVRTYAGLGSGSDLVARGLLSGGRLTGLQARVLLRLLLGGERPVGRDALVEALGVHGA
jgi:L-asparaginase